MAPRNRNLLVGVVVAGALLALGWMILKFSSTALTSAFGHGTRIRLVTDRADGVGEGSPLTYLGVPVGRVLSIQRQPNNTGVDIAAIIETSNPLPKNLTGVIKQQSPLGTSATIVLQPNGKPDSQPLTDGAVIPTVYLGGGMIPPEFTELAAQIRQQKLVQHLDEMILSIHDQLQRAGTALDAFNSIAGDQTIKDDIKTTVVNLRQTTDRLKQFSGQLDDLGVQTKATLTQVQTTVADSGKNVNQVSRDLGQRLTQIGALLDQFNTIAAKINKGNGTAGALVNDPRLYESMVDASKELNETIKSLKRLVEQWEQEGVSIKGFK